MKFKKLLALILSLLTAASVFCFPAYAQEETATPSFITEDARGLYVHGSSAAGDTQAWQLWQSVTDEDGNELEANVKYFFMPSGADKTKAEIYNGYTNAVTVNGTVIQPKSAATVSYREKTAYTVTADGWEYTLRFKNSTAEAAVYVNNPDADGNGTELYSYLTTDNDDKSKSASAFGAIVDQQGNTDNTAIKKIKGRGNTTWGKAKKPFNITYDSKVSIGGMKEGKKYSFLANYQDASLSRNRFLYDLSDAVGVPYASDSRYVDFYIDGVYYGSYQCCEKIEVGSGDLINDISDSDYLNEDGSLAENFSFCIEIDPSYGGDDYHTSASFNQLTIKSPELSSDMDYYEEVKDFVESKFSALYSALGNSALTEEELGEIIDIESFAKVYLINELSKNWDCGVSSFFMVHKQDGEGNWKLYASPVWDYDNSLGNAKGVAGELRGMGVSDYTSYEGWWCKYKGKSSRNKISTNIVNKCANNSIIMAQAAKAWFEDFVPAISVYKSSDIAAGELYSAKAYYELCRGSADMNFTRGWLLVTDSDWLAPHTSLKRASFSSGVYKVEEKAKTYPSDFKGEYDYMVDWLTSRAAWLSKEFSLIYIQQAKTYETGDVDGSGEIDIMDVTFVQMAAAGCAMTDAQKTAADINDDGAINVADATVLQKRLAKIS